MKILLHNADNYQQDMFFLNDLQSLLENYFRDQDFETRHPMPRLSPVCSDPRLNFFIGNFNKLRRIGRVDSDSLRAASKLLETIPRDEELRRTFTVIEKYVLQSVVRLVLSKEMRVYRCLRSNASTAFNRRWRRSNEGLHYLNLKVSVFYSPTGLSFSYGDLLTCGSVWVCPVCARKVSEKRGLEVLRAVKAHRGEFYGQPELGENQVYMVTYTVPHALSSSLLGLVANISKAFSWMKSQGSYKGSQRSVGIRSRIALLGTIRVLEVTWGAVHGWHVHIHEVLFVQRSLKKTEISGLFYDEEGRLAKTWGADGRATYVVDEKGLYCQWRKAAQRFGLGVPEPQGVDVQGADYVAEYVSKYGREPAKQLWLVSNELAKSHTKRNVGFHSDGTLKGYTPFDLLAGYKSRYLKKETKCSCPT